MLSIVRRNFGLKVFAFALAVAAWAYFHYSANPTITAHFDQQLSVPIVVTGLRPGFIARYTEKFAVVTIESPRNGPAIKPDEVQAVLNLAKDPDPGIVNVPISIIAPNVAIRSLIPASVTLAIDRIEERTIPVSIAYTGDRRDVVVESAAVSPASVTLRGIENDLSRVQSIRVVIPLPAKPGNLDAMLRPVPADARENEVGAVQLSPDLVRVRAHFIPSSGTRTSK